jgi:hypothetical protein
MRAGCSCRATTHGNRRIVLTGGPGAGKTAVLEVVRRRFCEHVDVLPESESILFGGGFPRRMTDAGGRAAQRAIFHVQHELEILSAAEPAIAVTLCDRGTIDGLAYWPGDPEDLWRDVGSERGRRHHRVGDPRVLPREGGRDGEPVIRRSCRPPTPRRTSCAERARNRVVPERHAN